MRDPKPLPQEHGDGQANGNRFTNSAGTDWFFAGSANKITDLSPLEQVFLFAL